MDFFFFKQKTAYEMRISDWSSDVCSSDLLLVQQADRVVLGIVAAEGVGADQLGEAVGHVRPGGAQRAHLVQHHRAAGTGDLPGRLATGDAPQSVVEGKSVSVRVDYWCRQIFKYYKQYYVQFNPK